MEISSESRSSSKLGNALKQLCNCTFKTDYDINLEFYKDDSATVPECSHSFTGSSRKKVLKTVALIAAASMIICLVSSLCSFFSKLLKN